MLTLLLDLDGTLTDSREGIVRSLAYGLRGQQAPVPDDAALAAWIGAPLSEVFRRLLPDPTEARVTAATLHYRERFDQIGWRENRVYAGVPAFLAALRARGIRSVMATSKPTLYAERIARHFSLALDAIYGSELDGARGVKSDLIAHVLAQERIAPARAVMLGDRHHDVTGARANGIRCLGITYGYGNREELESAGATWICDDLAQVLAVLEASMV